MLEPRLSLLVLHSHDLPGLIRFYQTVGLCFTEERHGNGPIHFVTQLGRLVLELYPLTSNDAAQFNGPLRLGFRVASIEAVLRELAKIGVHPQSAPRNIAWGRVVVVQDPDGRHVELSDASTDASV